MGKHDEQQAEIDTYNLNSAIDIKKIFIQTIEDLNQFSKIIPSGSIDDHETDVAEKALLGLEAYLLRRAARVPLKTSEEVEAMMDIWKLASDSSEECCDLSNKIVRNIFRHLSF